MRPRSDHKVKSGLRAIKLYHAIHFVVFVIILGLFAGVFLPAFYDAEYKCLHPVQIFGTPGADGHGGSAGPARQPVGAADQL